MIKSPKCRKLDWLSKMQVSVSHTDQQILSSMQSPIALSLVCLSTILQNKTDVGTPSMAKRHTPCCNICITEGCFLVLNGKDSFFQLFFQHWKEIVKSGAISCWTGEDQLQIRSPNSSSANNHLHHLFYNVIKGNVNKFSQYVTQLLLFSVWSIIWWCQDKMM